jgi:hypothetical protein
MLATRQDPKPSVLSDTELLAVITRDLRAIYSDVIREPLPDRLAAALNRLELHSSVSARLNITRPSAARKTELLSPLSRSLADASTGR